MFAPVYLVAFTLFGAVFSSLAIENGSQNEQKDFIGGPSNNYPIVLMPGFLGWGRNELEGGLKYWGAFQGDLQEQLKEEGYQVFSVAGGPVSSSYDRVVEIYTSLVGGKVDYGEAHSTKYGHERYGETYDTGLFPDWGSLDEEGSIRKVHLVSHSFGGMDCRLLTHLLNYGSEEEMALNNDDINPLFKGGKDWVASCSSISSPHDGTSLAVLVNNYFPQLQQIILSIAAIFGLESENHLYDFKLQQWGITRRKEESLSQYIERVYNSKAWTSKKDISIWDLRPDGAAEFNDYVRTVPNVFYFTYSTEATKPALVKKNNEIPDLVMIPLVWPIATIMGFFNRINEQDIPVDNSWHKNDGVVNTVSMQSPKVGFNPDRDIPEVIEINDATNVIPGVFYSFPLLEKWDHMAIIGAGVFEVLPFYQQVAKLLTSLPINTGSNLYVSPMKVTQQKNIQFIDHSKACDSKTPFDTICLNNNNGTSIMSQDDCDALKEEMNSWKGKSWCEAVVSQTLADGQTIAMYLR